MVAVKEVVTVCLKVDLKASNSAEMKDLSRVAWTAELMVAQTAPQTASLTVLYSVDLLDIRWVVQRADCSVGQMDYWRVDWKELQRVVMMVAQTVYHWAY